MNRELLTNFIYNITVLLTLAMIYTAFYDKLRGGKLCYKISLGLCTGAAGLVIMTTAVQFGGAIFDTRTILLSVTGMFFGFIPTAVAGTIMSIYRLWIGGAGVYTGVLTIITTSAIGILYNKYFFKETLKFKNSYHSEFYFFGLIVHVDMLLCMFAFPKDQALNILKNITFPVLVLYPIATYFLCKLFLVQYVRSDLMFKLQESEEKYRELAENMSDVIWTCDLDCNYIYISPSIEKLIGEPKEVYIKKSMEEKFAPEDLKKIRSVLKEELKKENDPLSDKNRSRIIEVKHLKSDGTSIWISMHVSFMRDAEGTFSLTL